MQAVNKGGQRMLFLIAAIVICAAVGIGASIFLKGDNFITQEASRVENKLIEKELNLPSGSVDVDLNIMKIKGKQP